MALFRTASLTDLSPSIEGRGVYMRAPQMSDFNEWATLREMSRDFLVPWEPTWPADDLPSDVAYPFFLFHRETHALLGGLTLANIRRGCAQAASLGYWMGRPYAHQGHMTAGVEALFPFVFGTLRLHRLEAACIPTNAASTRLLEKTGFRREGYAREYLCINGIWQDHLLFARLRGDALANG